MKKTIVLLAFAGVVLYSCKDKADTPDPTPCYVASYTLNGDSVAYHYDAQGRITSVTGARTVDLSYDNGLLSTVNEGNNLWTLYYNGSDQPQRIVVSSNGSPRSYIDFEYSGEQISNFSYLNLSQDTMVRTLLYYDSNGGLDSMVRLEYDPASNALIPLFEVHNVTHDGKTNPFSTQMVLRLLHLEDPIAIGKFNVSQANFTVLGTEVEVNFDLTYDSEGRLIESIAVFNNPQVPQNRAHFTYTCK